MPAAGEPSRRGTWVWAVLAGLAAAWERQAFVQLPRRAPPTLSSRSNELLRSPAWRGVALLLWLATGAWLARR